MDVDNFDVNNYKVSHESSTEWKLRRSFMEAHSDKFDINRLQCLASCFINVECYGCTYPEKVMKQLATLSDDFSDELEDYRRDIKEKKTQLQFVKASGEKDHSGFSQNRKNTTCQTEAQETAGKSENGASCAGADAKPKAEEPATESDDVTDENNPVSDEGNATKSGQYVPPNRRMAKPYGTGLTMHSETPPRPNIPAVPRQHQQCKVCALCLTLVTSSQDGKAYGKKQTLAEAAASSMLTAAAPKTVAAAKAKKAYGGMFQPGAKFQSTDLALGEASTSAMEDEDSTQSDSVLLRQFSVLRDTLKDPKCKKENAAATIHYAAQKSKLRNEIVYKTGMSGLEGKFNIALLLLNKVIAAKAEHRVKKQVKNAVYDMGIINLSKPYMKIEDSKDHTGYKEVVCSDLPIVDRQEAIHGLLKTKCSVYIDQELFVEDFGNSKTSAKLNACVKAVTHLRKHNWTIQVKRPVDCDVEEEIDSLTKDQVFGDVRRETCPLPDDNVGRRMLEKLGWAGGGIGKHESGRKDPVAVESVINRRGLGLHHFNGMSRDFVPKIRDVLHKYAKSDNPYDFAFAPDFSREERAIIHEQAQKFSLKTKSYGSGEDRYLVVSRKRNAEQLLTYIIKHGGKTKKYELVPPSSKPEPKLDSGFFWGVT